MKYITLVLATFISFTVYAQTEADMIVGKWMKMPKEDLVIEVFSTGAGYSGKIQWSGKADSARQKGYLILENLQFDKDTRSWEDGKIYDPCSGSQYKAAAKLKADGTLEVLGYKGFKFIGSKKLFRRVK